MNILFRTTSNLRYFVRIVISNLFEKRLILNLYRIVPLLFTSFLLAYCK